jgi:K+ transporter
LSAACPSHALAFVTQHGFIMVQNAGSAVDYFNLPANRVIELETRVEI